MADSKAFLAWAKEQAQAHGASSKISNFSKLGSKYSLEGFVTWADVVAAAERDAAEAAKPEPAKKKSSKTTAVESSKFVASQLQDLKNNLKAAKDGILSEPVGSTLYNKYKALIPKREAEIAELTAKLDKAKASEQAASNKADTASSINSTKDVIQRLTEQKQRTTDLGGDTSSIDKQIAEAQGKLQTLTKSAETAASSVGPNYTKAPPAISGGAAKVAAKKPTPASTPSKTSTPVAGTKLTPEQLHTKIAEALQASGNMGGYAVQMGLIESDPSLKELFQRDIYDPIMAGKEPVSVDKFKADLINTKWYKSYAEPAREAEAIRLGDPATWDKSIESATQVVKDNALSMGYDITDAQAKELANIALHSSGGKAEQIGGLVLTELKKQITSTGKINFASGTAATGLSSLKTFAADYGVSQLYPEATLKDFQNKIEKGTLTQAAAETLMKSSAKSIYGALAPQIDAGFTTASILSPYKTLYGQILEKDPNAIALSDTQFMSNIFAKDAKDPNVQTLKPLWQYQQDLKNDPSWAYTKNAKDSIDSTAHSILTSLGLTW